ncbi:MAG: hypothetical protein COV70_00760 [Parcubacteria group bacterium CG11_big_fil_rev_8_21_14_0_20_39_22]|nr:MAG: hypothetical protein COV70_00760 [Parcubacteria group bacterium CG11_big_fil_rev_8_21_14_0_20_39_22]
MYDINIKKKRKTKIIFRMVSVLLVILCVFFAKVSYNAYVKKQESEENYRRAEASLVEIEKRQARLEKEIEKLSTDRGIEEEIREKFRVAKEGEKMMVLLGSEEVEEKPEEKKTWWKKLLGIF